MTKKLVAASVPLLAFALFLTQPSWISGSDPVLPNRGGGRMRRPDISASYGKLRLSFEPNRGQMDARVNFLSRGQGYNLLLGPNEAVLDLRQPRARAGHAQPAPSVQLRMQLLAANPASQPVAREELPGKSNYFIGNDPAKWRTGIPTYAKVEYRDVYPGVDLVYYGNGRQLEHDFVVRPGADPHAISLGFPGARTLALDS